MFHVKHPPLPDPGVSLEQRLEEYLKLVQTYHRTLDLVSDVALARLPELLDQAQVYGRVISEVGSRGTVLDLGSGVGLPGVVVAATLPHRRVLLVERRRRRVAFLRIVVGKLALRRVVVVEADVRQLRREDLHGLLPPEDELAADRVAPPPGDEGDQGEAPEGVATIRVVVAQAVGTFEHVYCLTRHLHAAQVTVLSRKGAGWDAEVDRLGAKLGCAPAVRAAQDLGNGGSLIAVELPGGLPCPRSG